MFKYVIVITGQVEAEDEAEAQRKAVGGVTIGARMLEFPVEIGVRAMPLAVEPSRNGGSGALEH